ncbi:hypothetical protein BGZ83_003731 [Gryganskiella cystojenkinii]|nr:hypothetical protein BGZ83_003731 [Gryganskiella cystojenkinii]
MQIILFTLFAAVVTAAITFPSDCVLKDGVACYTKCPADGTDQTCYENNRKSREVITEELIRAHESLPNSVKLTECYCFRSLTAKEINDGSPVADATTDKCSYYGVRCLQRVELGDVDSCAELFFRGKEIKGDHCTSIRNEVCQRFTDILAAYDDMISVTAEETNTELTKDDREYKLSKLRAAEKDFNLRKEVACEGTQNGAPFPDPDKKEA